MFRNKQYRSFKLSKFNICGLLKLYENTFYLAGEENCHLVFESPVSIFLSFHATSVAALAVPPVFLIVLLKKGISHSSDDEDSGFLE